MTLHRRSLLGVGLALLFVPQAEADPSGTVTKFMNAPVSLFSYGLDRVRNNLTAIAEVDTLLRGGKIVKYSSGVKFDWDTSHINLNLYRYTITGDDPSNLEEECKTVVQKVRLGGGISQENGKPFFGDVSFFAQEFFPTGYSVKSLSEDDGKALDALMSINVTIYNEKGVKLLECTAPLLGLGYSVRK